MPVLSMELKDKEIDLEAKAQTYQIWPPSKELTHLIGKLSSTNLKEQMVGDSGLTIRGVSVARLPGGRALEYARRVNVHNDYHTLKQYLKRWFSTKEAPVVARRQLTFLKQHDNETIEEFSQRVLSLTLDAY